MPISMKSSQSPWQGYCVLTPEVLALMQEVKREDAVAQRPAAPPHLLEVRSTRALARSLVREALGWDVSPMPPPPVGVVRRPRRAQWTPAEVLAALLAFQAQHGRWPTGTEFRRGPALGLPGRSAIAHHYGSRAQLLRTARQQIGAHG